MKTFFPFIAMLLVYGISAQSGEFQSTVMTAVQANSGSGYGVYGSSLTNIGVYGKSGSDFGVLGESISGYGVRGESTNTYGIYGISTSSTGIYGASQANNGTGIYGTNNTGTGVEGSGGTQGVYGQSTNGYGVYASSTNSNGLYARSANSGAIYGFAESGGSGVIGYSQEGNGVTGSTGGESGFDFYALSTDAAKNYGTASSRRWKENIVNIPDPLGKLSQLRGVYFDWKKDRGGHHSLGFIAEEVGEVLPEIVLYETNGVDAKGMDYSKMTPLLVEAANAMRSEYEEKFEQQQFEIDQLKQQIVVLRQLLDSKINLLVSED